MLQEPEPSASLGPLKAPRFHKGSVSDSILLVAGSISEFTAQNCAHKFRFRA